MLVAAALLGGCASLPFFEARTSRRGHERAERAGGQAVRPRGRRALAAARAAARLPRPGALPEGAEIRRHRRPRARSPRRRGAGAGARPARDRGLLRRRREDRAERRRRERPAAASCITVAARAARRRARAWPSPRAAPLAPRTPTARRALAPTASTSCARPGRSRPASRFAKPAWSGAKNTALGELRADGYPTATWTDTHAPHRRHRATPRSSRSTIERGPLFRLGAIRVEGVQPLRRSRGAPPRDLLSRRRLQREDAARLPGAAGQGRPLRRRLGRARRRPARPRRRRCSSR